jgi:hypothetical protein
MIPVGNEKVGVFLGQFLPRQIAVLEFEQDSVPTNFLNKGVNHFQTHVIVVQSHNDWLRAVS